ncbi:unnamed protein product, partial [Porites lobata]
ISNTDTSKVVISGDWNSTLNPIDKRGGQPWRARDYRNSLMNLMEELNLIDIYRQIHPTTKSFAYESKPLNLKSRIDFFSLFLVLCVVAGPGLWKFNNTLLEDDNYKELIEFYYPQIL